MAQPFRSDTDYTMDHIQLYTRANIASPRQRERPPKHGQRREEFLTAWLESLSGLPIQFHFFTSFHPHVATKDLHELARLGCWESGQSQRQSVMLPAERQVFLDGR